MNRAPSPCAVAPARPSFASGFASGTRRTKMGRFLTGAALAAAVLAFVPDMAVAQSRPELIPVPGRIKMALYRPDSGPAPTVGIIVMHRTSNYLTHLACTELARRGFLMLCSNSRF